MRPLTVTTSWDDGHPLDLRLAEQLAERGMAGTFYLTRDFPGMRGMNDREIRELSVIPGVEIGAHTLTHPDLPRLSASEASREIVDSKRWLEDLLGQAVQGFAYPRGRHSRAIRELTQQAGFSYARTVRAGHLQPHGTNFAMPTTQQFYPHKRWALVRRAIREVDVPGACSLLARRRWAEDPACLMSDSLRRSREGDVLHLWGHSWEIEALRFWDQLAETLERVQAVEPTFVTNHQVVLARGEDG